MIRKGFLWFIKSFVIYFIILYPIISLINYTDNKNKKEVNMIDYVVGFAFSPQHEEVLLVKKNRPEWQKGLMNGIGGKIEPGESGLEAMIRECREETGLTLTWENRGIMRGINKDNTSFSCQIFYASSYEIYKYKQIEDEELDIIMIDMIRTYNCIPNVPFLIEFGISSDVRPYLILEYGTGL